MTDTAVYAIVVGAVFMVLAVLYFAHLSNLNIAKLIPQSTLDTIESLLATQGDRFLQAGLTTAATTPTPFDDQFFITGLELRGWKVTGDPETGYTVTPPTPVTPPPSV